MTGRAEELLAAGTAALRIGDPRAARPAFEEALAAERSGDALEGLARASYLDLEFRQAISEWEQAYGVYRASGDQVGTVRVARMLSYMYGSIVGDWAVSSGWIARAQTMLDPSAESAEDGWVALNLGMFDADRSRKETNFRAALAVARRLGDVDLEVATLAYLGASLVHDDRYEEGMVLLDEALAAVAGSEVDDFVVLEEVFCQLFSACEHAHDISPCRPMDPHR